MTRGSRRQGPPAIRGTIDPDTTKSWWRRILPIARAHGWVFGLALGISLAGLVFQVMIPSVLNGAVNQLAQKNPTANGELYKDVITIAVLAIAALAAGVASRYLQLRAAYDVEYDLRNITMRHLSRMAARFYDRVGSGDLISRANSDIRALQTFLAMAPQVGVQLTMTLIAFGFMLSINVPLALLTMATLPVSFFIGVRMRRVMYPLAWLIQTRLSNVTSIVEEDVSGVAVVKSFAAERREVRRLELAARRLEWAQVREADLRAKWMPLIQSMPTVGLFFVLAGGGALSLVSNVQPGVILAFAAYLVMLQQPFMMLGQVIMLAQRSSASATRVFEILDEKPEIIDEPGAVEIENVLGRVEFRGVDFRYGTGLAVLDNLDLEIAPGETVAIVGRTGSGKSTLARLLARFYDVDYGVVAVDGRDVHEVTLHSLRSAVGLVTEEPFLFSDSVRENIAFGRPEASIGEIQDAARAASAHDFIMELADGYDTVIGERGMSLSGGQRQRLALARAILLNPPVLVLDDATSAIDVRTESAIHESLRTLMKGRTTIIVAHRLSTIALAERVVLLDGGRVIADGTHEELLATSPEYMAVLAIEQLDGEFDPERALDDDGVTDEERAFAAAERDSGDTLLLPTIVTAASSADERTSR